MKKSLLIMIHFLKKYLNLLFNPFINSFLSFFVASFIALSCIFHNPWDSSLDVVSGNYITNILGKYGALISDIFIQLFGQSFYFLSFCFI